MIIWLRVFCRKAGDALVPERTNAGKVAVMVLAHFLLKTRTKWWLKVQDERFRPTIVPDNKSIFLSHHKPEATSATCQNAGNQDPKFKPWGHSPSARARKISKAPAKSPGHALKLYTPNVYLLSNRPQASTKWPIYLSMLPQFCYKARKAWKLSNAVFSCFSVIVYNIL